MAVNESEPLWTWPALCAAVGQAESVGPDVTGVSIDSRLLRAGDLFVALSGARDGNLFAAAAVQSGATGVLVSRAVEHAVPALVVDDTLTALRAIAAAARARTAAQVVAITGSSGKTTLKTLLAHAWQAHATEGNLHNHLGVPLTLARMPAASRHAVIEIGTNHPGEIEPLVRLTRPNVAVLLNVLPAHIGNFAGMPGLTSEKLSIASGLEDDGIFVMPAALRSAYNGVARVVTFGTESTADVRLRTGAATSTDCPALAAHIEYGGHAWQLNVPGGGEHRALSCAAACAVAIALAVGPGSSLSDSEAAALAAFVERLAETSVPIGRGNVTQVGRFSIIDDSYNANPASMGYALRALAQLPGRKQALLGDMLELGDQEQAMHAGLLEHCAGIDRVHCVGPRMRALYERLPDAQRGEYLADPDTCTADRVAGWLLPGDSLMVKGSKMMFWHRNVVRNLLAVLR